MRVFRALRAFRSAYASAKVAKSVWLRPKAQGRGSSDALLEDRIGRGLTALVPPKLARFVAIELVIVVSLLTAAFRRRPVDGVLSFSYHETTRIRLLLVAGPLMLLFEGIVINQWLGPQHPWLRLLHLAVCVYATVWVWGAYAMMKSRPQRLDGAELWLHRGVWGYLRVPVANVLAVRPVTPDPRGSQGAQLSDALAFAIKGTEQVEVTFRDPVIPMGFLTPLRPTTRLVVSADNAGSLSAAIARAAKL
jgi:hypothetical protein